MKDPRAELGKPLTGMQVMILAMIADGLTNPEIMDRLHVTIHTVNTQMRLIKGRLGANTRGHLMALAYQANILTVPLHDVPSLEERIEYVDRMVTSGDAKHLRESCAVTLIDMARTSGVGERTLRRWESEQVSPNGAHLDAYYRVLAHLEHHRRLPQRVFTPKPDAV